jgi:hypothetical protein
MCQIAGSRRTMRSRRWHDGSMNMSQAAAKIILDVMMRHCAEQDAALIEIQPLCTADEFKQYKLMIGRSMGTMLLDVMNPIVGKYPVLKPDRMKT